MHRRLHRRFVQQETVEVGEPPSAQTDPWAYTPVAAKSDPLSLNAKTAQRSVPVGIVGLGNRNRRREVLTIDAQVHAYERNHAGRPWVGTLAGPAEVTGEQMVAAMDAVGVDGAVLVSPFSMYRYDASYATEVYAAHPNRFGLVKPVRQDRRQGLFDYRRRSAENPSRAAAGRGVRC
jgi:hypothetical protein